MSAVGGPVVRRIIEVSSGDLSRQELLAKAGLSPGVDRRSWAHEYVDADTYYDLLESAAPEGDLDLPVRYGEAVEVDDFGALGLALKTASTLKDSLLRLVRYILVLSDTLEYEMSDEIGGARLVMSRPGHRRGARLANECALAAIVSLLRQVSSEPVDLVAVSFRHPRPDGVMRHGEFFGCPLRFGDRFNAIHLSDRALDTPTRLGDDGLSAFLLATLDDLRESQGKRDMVAVVYQAVTDALPDGRPSRANIARRLGMSERTLHRRLAEFEETFQTVSQRAQRDAAQALLAEGGDSIAEIAFLTGFSDQSAFTRAFKSWTGRTPLDFRQSAT